MQTRAVAWNLPVGRGRITYIAPRQNLHHQRRVLHRLGQRPYPVQRRGKRNQPVPAHPAIRRQNPDHAAERRRLPHRAAGVRPQARDTKISRHRCRRATTGPTRHPVQRARIPHRPIRRVFIRRAHRKLVAVQLAQQYRTRGLQPAHHRRVIGRPIPGQNLRPGRRRRSLHRQHILDAHRHARQQRQRLTRSHHAVDPLRLRHRPLPAQRKIAVDSPSRRPVQRGDAIVVLLRQGHSRDLPLCHRSACRDQRKALQIHSVQPVLHRSVSSAQ